ncbi:hypothetical protein PGT21_009148 [Puccinia graminis f. sp. tritici]|uniref:Uncharacterized protein n=1 Tax=Puccinia graminis f. sp. tritici TaxID=56615 RepID=A0A5B0MME7_PUCGR|nr:hypothetical protein PGT21_009148 [Puccinia graminis f. sp. tritici]
MTSALQDDQIKAMQTTTNFRRRTVSQPLVTDQDTTVRTLIAVLNRRGKSIVRQRNLVEIAENSDTESIKENGKDLSPEQQRIDEHRRYKQQQRSRQLGANPRAQSDPVASHREWGRDAAAIERARQERGVRSTTSDVVFARGIGDDTSKRQDDGSAGIPSAVANPSGGSDRSRPFEQLRSVGDDHKLRRPSDDEHRAPASARADQQNRAPRSSDIFVGRHDESPLHALSQR